MGYTAYCSTARLARSALMGYATNSVDEVFTQQKARVIHEEMNPANIKIRECRDSAAHPNTVPILFFLDVTGSMGTIPHMMIKEGLPKLMGNLTQKGVEDAALMFGAVGDHECDRFPLQVAQFESGDAELDMWLTRTYLEGGGGGNAGESYLLAWQFAANHVVTDAWEKRGKKGFLFTVGDEPCLGNLPKSAVSKIYAENAIQQSANVSIDELLKNVQEKYNVYHLHVTHSSGGSRSLAGWKTLLGQNCIEVPDYTTIPDVIANTILTHKDSSSNVVVEGKKKKEKAKVKVEEETEVL